MRSRRERGPSCGLRLLSSIAILLALSSCERKLRARDREQLEQAERELERQREEQRLARKRASRPEEPEVLAPEPPFGPLRADNAGFPCAVDDVLAAKCRRCHTVPARHNAPFSLLKWEDTRENRSEEPIWKHMAKVVRSGYMPYAIPANPAVEPLTEAEKQVLLDWTSGGAERAACDPHAPPPPPKKAPRPGKLRSAPMGGAPKPAP